MNWQDAEKSKPPKLEKVLLAVDKHDYITGQWVPKKELLGWLYWQPVPAVLCNSG